MFPQRKFNKACSDGNQNMVRKMLSSKILNKFNLLRINGDGKSGDTPLTAAIKHGHFSTIELLLESGADVNISDLRGTPLILALKKGELAIVKLLVKAGADVNKQGSISENPLIVAIRGGDYSTVKYLINSKAKVNSNTGFSNPLTEACKKGSKSIVKLLSNSGADFEFGVNKAALLIQSILQGHVEIVKFLIDSGADVNEDINSTTPLIAACRTGNSELVELLLSAGAILELNNASSNSALEIATISCNSNEFIKIIRTILNSYPEYISIIKEFWRSAVRNLKDQITNFDSFIPPPSSRSIVDLDIPYDFKPNVISDLELLRFWEKYRDFKEKQELRSKIMRSINRDRESTAKGSIGHDILNVTTLSPKKWEELIESLNLERKPVQILTKEKFEIQI